MSDGKHRTISAVLFVIVASLPALGAATVAKPVNAPRVVQAIALKERIGTTTIYKEFSVSRSGQAEVSFEMRSDGAHSVDARVFFGSQERCRSSTAEATYTMFTCAAKIAAKDVIRIFLFPNGREGALRNARLQLISISGRASAVATKD